MEAVVFYVSSKVAKQAGFYKPGVCSILSVPRASCSCKPERNACKRPSLIRAAASGHLHDRAAKGVAGGLRVGGGLGHHVAAERVAGGLRIGGRLGHDGAAERVAGRLGGAVLGGLVSRHFEK